MLAMSRETADLEAVRKRLETIDSRQKDLEAQKQNLLVRARRSGLWIAPKESELVGKWIPKGSLVGEIVGEKGFRFSSVVSQNDAANLFVDTIQYAQVRIFGHAGEDIEVKKYGIVPFQHDKLPSAALGWFGGGEVAVSMSDDTGLKTSEPFFLIFAEVVPDDAVMFFHGRSGKIRFSMEKEALLVQWGRSFRQLLQRRYRI
jgi:putative peptide zinc metalloprotease protein